MECHFDALPRTPFPALRDFPSRGNEKYGEKNRASYTSCTIPVCPPLVAGATTFPPQAGALWMLSHGAMSLQESIERPILPPEQGEVRRSRIGGGERSEPVSRMVILPYDTGSQSRNADFILIAHRAIPQPSGQRPVKLKNPPANGRSILRTFLHNPSTQPAAPAAPLCALWAHPLHPGRQSGP